MKRSLPTRSWVASSQRARLRRVPAHAQDALSDLREEGDAIAVDDPAQRPAAIELGTQHVDPDGCHLARDLHDALTDEGRAAEEIREADDPLTADGCHLDRRPVGIGVDQGRHERERKVGRRARMVARGQDVVGLARDDGEVGRQTRQRVGWQEGEQTIRLQRQSCWHDPSL